MSYVGPFMTPPTLDHFPGAVEEVIRELGITREEAIAALQYIAAPTIRPVVGVREFIESPYYMGTVKADGTSTIYPKVMEELEQINCGEYDESVMTGGIGSGKTTVALYSTAYQLYKLSCYEDPHNLYGLDSASEIVFIFQSINAKAANAVDYQRFKAMIEKSPYFREYFPFDKSLQSELNFPKRIIVRPVSSKDTAAIGQNVFGGIIDEINFMALIQDSKASIDGGVYDQAKALYDSISKRRRSRFGVGGGLPGLLCMVSSARYPGQFTDRKIEERNQQLQQTGRTSIYVYDKREWDIKPMDRYTGNWFDIFIGDEGRKPRILKEGEREAFSPLDQETRIMSIPEEYRHNFETDMMGSLRDTAGVATIARHPFIPDREKVVSCTRKTDIIFNKEMVDFVAHKLEISGAFKNHKIQRFAHCDLAITGDSAGFAVGHVEKFIPIKRGDDLEILPQIWVDALLEIKPPKGGEIQLFKVREIIYAMKKLGLNITWVTFDQYQSRDSMQLLKQQGYQVGYQSIDVNSMPYDFTKNAIYDGRVNMPHHDKCLIELLSLEKDVKKNKVDHPPGGSKDVADALAGVVFGLTMRRETWAANGVSLGAIPKSIAMALEAKNRQKEVAKGVEVAPQAQVTAATMKRAA